MKRLAKPKPRRQASCPYAQPPCPLDAVLRTGTGGSSGSWRRLWLGRGPVYHARPPSLTLWPKAEPEATPRCCAQEARRFGSVCYQPGPSSVAGGCCGSLTERTLMRIGVSNRHAILSLPTRLQPEPARPPALSTANCWANDRHLCRKSGRSKRRGNALDSAEVHLAPAERRAKRNRARSLLTNRLLRNSSYSQPGLEVGAGSSFRMRKEDLSAPPAAQGGRSLRGGV